MGKWVCKECGYEVFEIKAYCKEIISRLNKKGVTSEIVYKDKIDSEYSTTYRCDGCGLEGLTIDEISEWKDE